jgi:flagellar biosynthesis GTPase FlhF
MHSKAPVEIHDDSSIPRERIEASASGPSSDVPPVRDRIDTDSPLKSSSERLFKTEKNSSSIDKSDEKPRGSLLFTDEGTSEDETTAASGMSEKEKKAKKEEEKLRKEKEREEKKIKKEEEKLRREKEKEERRAKKEQEKQTKRDADRKKKEEKKSKPKIKEKRTSNGKGIDDFVLKVYGSKEYFLPGTSNNLNKLLDYDYICKCINNQQPIDLMYVEKYSEMGSVPVSARLADLDDMAIDGAIARETSETEVTEIYLEREFMPSKPFWSFAGDRSEFQIKVRVFNPCCHLSRLRF